MKKFLQDIPKFILGPIVVVIGIIYMVIQDPPRSVCDIQFEIFKQENDKYLYGHTKKGIKIPPQYVKQLKMCQETNSPGGCYDWLQEMKSVLHTLRNIPSDCQESLDNLDPLKGWMSSAIFTFSQISWNDSTVVRPGLYHWLDTEDIAVFCRLKHEYKRLVGEQAYTTLHNGLIMELVKLKKMDLKSVSPRTILTYKCPIF